MYLLLSFLARTKLAVSERAAINHPIIIRARCALNTRSRLMQRTELPERRAILVECGLTLSPLYIRAIRYYLRILRIPNLMAALKRRIFREGQRMQR